MNELRVAQVMVPQPVVVSPGHTLQQVLHLMNEQQVGSVLVVDCSRLVGIFTERDLLRHAVHAPVGWRQRPVSDWMTPDPMTVSPESGWEAAMALMDKMHVRHLPVVEDGKLVGMLAARDLMSHRAQHLDRLVTEKTRELQRANEWLRERDATLQLHMTIAGRLQARLLPEAPPFSPEIECHAHYEPLDPLGGDHYDFARPDADHVGILIADASGHSIPAAMVAVLARTAFATAARDALRPGAVLAAINHQLHGLTGEHFVTAFYGLFHRGRKTLAYANAGHPYPYRYVARDRTCHPLVAQGLMLGVLADTQYEEKHLQLSSGDRLCLYTDGMIECLDASGESFGAGRLQQCMCENGSEPVRMLVQRLAEAVRNFRGSQPPNDDLTILGVQMH